MKGELRQKNPDKTLTSGHPLREPTEMPGEALQQHLPRSMNLLLRTAGTRKPCGQAQSPRISLTEEALACSDAVKLRLFPTRCDSSTLLHGSVYHATAKRGLAMIAVSLRSSPPKDCSSAVFAYSCPAWDTCGACVRRDASLSFQTLHSAQFSCLL